MEGKKNGQVAGRAAMNGAAVVIGVDRTGGLTPLDAAARGAEEVAGWLRQDGYEVALITDRPEAGEARPVTRKAILEAVASIVDRGTFEKLVIYFAGHGYLNSTSELWLLSGAPDDPGEAVDETLSAEMARSSNIRNVVFISDCCRSIPATLLGQRVNGGSIFPNRSQGNVDTEVDHFFATQPGTAAIEAKIAEAALATGLFTKVLRDSHTDPPPELTIAVAGSKAVPSRWLKKVLPDRTDEEAQRKSLALTQRAQIRLESDQSAFVGLARFTPAPTGPKVGSAPPGPGGSGGPVFEVSVRRTRTHVPPPPPRRRWRDASAERATPPEDMGFVAPMLSEDVTEADIRALRDDVASPRLGRPLADLVPDRRLPFWLEVHGDVERVMVAGGGPGRLRPGTADGAFYELPAPGKACSVAIRFGDGSGTIVAGLRGYLCRIAADETGVTDISYAPFAGEWAALYANMHEKIDRTRAIACAAVARGLMQIDKKNARHLAEATRRFKMFDPALGMVAALAYAAAGVREQAVSVRDYSRRDLGIDLFDIWLLAGAEKGGPPPYPFCPMMTQSWSYLEARGVEVHPKLKAAGRHSGFWTTFSSGDMAAILELVERGRLK